MTPFKAIENMLRYLFTGSLDPIQKIDLITFSNSSASWTLAIDNNIFNIMTYIIYASCILLTLFYLTNMCLIYLKIKK